MTMEPYNLQLYHSNEDVPMMMVIKFLSLTLFLLNLMRQIMFLSWPTLYAPHLFKHKLLFILMFFKKNLKSIKFFPSDFVVNDPKM